jgi:hypothetical protein
MTTEIESNKLDENRLRDAEVERGWVKVGLFAAASALAGGLAAAWYYRKTLAQLRRAEDEAAVSPPQDLGSD